ncbi:hypothetical protein [Pseudomonas sp. MYb185]|jgi:hypothetical protein|uniref:hypothetical protein n=1 Tax=Pseudomonas sp. MYb185 TaxID=1848729 RepID=UPI000CFBDDCD|nr:hypothetical protein [Pseudomonas sp. MYb185]PRB81531.1 hypothetical protein CQ007_10320 [Pseudomonas sp. MYb185]
MAFNLYGEPIPDIVTEKPAVELPQRADGRACNIYGEPIDDAETVAAKIRQLPPTPVRVLAMQGAVDATFSTLGSVAAFLAEASQHLDDDEDEAPSCGLKDDPVDGWVYPGERIG